VLTLLCAVTYYRYPSTPLTGRVHLVTPRYLIGAYISAVTPLVDMYHHSSKNPGRAGSFMANVMKMEKLEVCFRYFGGGVVNLLIYGGDFFFVYAGKGYPYTVFAQGDYPDAVFV